MTASRKRKRVKAWLWFNLDEDEWEIMDMTTSRNRAAEWKRSAHADGRLVPCTITYTEPPKRKARR